MRPRFIATAYLLTLRELVRSRMALILLLIIPALFFALILLTTTSTKEIAFKLGSISDDLFIRVSQRKEALIFIGLAAVGLLTSFLGLNLIQRHTDANRRLVLCGFKPAELVFSRLAVLLCVIILISIYIAAIMSFFYIPERFPMVVLGFILGGFVYGCYGLMVGAIVKRELEGILLIVLLANIDAGWLQNPIYYAESQNRAIIRHLPAYFPSQTSMASAFTENSVISPLIWGLIYGLIFMTIAVAIFAWKMRIRK